jgi:hypothetical protein
LLGDCHAIAIGRATKAAGIPFCGGPIGTASEFNTGFFDVHDGEVAFRKPEAERLYREFLSELDVVGLGELSIPLVSTFGFSVHLFAHEENWRIYRDRDGSFAPHFLSGRLFDGIIRAMARGALDFYRHARGLGLRVLVVVAPQRIPDRSDPAIFLAAQDVMCRAVRELGAQVVDLRARSCDEKGRQRPELCSDESPVHGNIAFGRLVLDELLARGL